MKTNLKRLFSKTKGEIQDQYAEGRWNQSEYELYMHLWDKTHDKPCHQCIFCLIEQGQKEEVYSWLQDLSWNDCSNFFDAFMWPEGHHYCMSSYEYYMQTGFLGLQRQLTEFYWHIMNHDIPDYYSTK